MSDFYVNRQDVSCQAFCPRAHRSWLLQTRFALSMVSFSASFVVPRRQGMVDASPTHVPGRCIANHALRASGAILLSNNSAGLLQCGGCVSKGEAALKGVPGVQEAVINLATNTATVTLTGERKKAFQRPAVHTSQYLFRIPACWDGAQLKSCAFSSTNTHVSSSPHARRVVLSRTLHAVTPFSLAFLIFRRARRCSDGSRSGT